MTITMMTLFNDLGKGKSIALTLKFKIAAISSTTTTTTKKRIVEASVLTIYTYLSNLNNLLNSAYAFFWRVLLSNC